jgi:hypothetical protein
MTSITRVVNFFARREKHINLFGLGRLERVTG